LPVVFQQLAAQLVDAERRAAIAETERTALERRVTELEQEREQRPAVTLAAIDQRLRPIYVIIGLLLVLFVGVAVVAIGPIFSPQ
jgi:hypothetical protein